MILGVPVAAAVCYAVLLVCILHVQAYRSVEPIERARFFWRGPGVFLLWLYGNAGGVFLIGYLVFSGLQFGLGWSVRFAIVSFCLFLPLHVLPAYLLKSPVYAAAVVSAASLAVAPAAVLALLWTTLSSGLP